MVPDSYKLKFFGEIYYFLIFVSHNLMNIKLFFNEYKIILVMNIKLFLRNYEYKIFL